MTDRKRRYLIAWLVALSAGYIVAFAVVWRVFVHSRQGQLLDTIALVGDSIGRDRVDGVVDGVLNVISVLSLAAATAVIGFIALLRRRFTLALVATALIGGANITTQLLKHGFGRPDLGVDGTYAPAGNSLPSGHTTVAASVAAALVFVLPPRVRGLGGLCGAGYAAVTGIATLSAGWHRPSDAVAAILVVGAWAAVAALMLVLAAGPDHSAEAGDPQVRDPQVRDAHPVSVAALALTGVTLLVVAVVALTLTDHVALNPLPQLSRRRLFVAYAGSAAGIAGTACAMVALLMATVHRVVPRRSD